MLPSNNCKGSRAAHQPSHSSARMAKPRSPKAWLSHTLAVASTEQPWQGQAPSARHRSEIKVN